jgi:hypothetical protein
VLVGEINLHHFSKPSGRYLHFCLWDSSVSHFLILSAFRTSNWLLISYKIRMFNVNIYTLLFLYIKIAFIFIHTLFILLFLTLKLTSFTSKLIFSFVSSFQFTFNFAILLYYFLIVPSFSNLFGICGNHKISYNCLAFRTLFPWHHFKEVLVFFIITEIELPCLPFNSLLCFNLITLLTFQQWTLMMCFIEFTEMSSSSNTQKLFALFW